MEAFLPAMLSVASLLRRLAPAFLAPDATGRKIVIRFHQSISIIRSAATFY